MQPVDGYPAQSAPLRDCLRFGVTADVPRLLRQRARVRSGKGLRVDGEEFDFRGVTPRSLRNEAWDAPEGKTQNILPGA